MDRTLYPLDYQALAREALDGGFTTALDGWRPTTGYAVSTRSDAENHVYLTSTFRDTSRNVQNVLADALYHYVIRHGYDLRHGYLLGAWLDRDNDRVTIDLVQIFENRNDALGAAAYASQQAIYHLDTGETVSTGALYGALHTAETPRDLDAIDRWLDDVGRDEAAEDYSEE